MKHTFYYVGVGLLVILLNSCSVTIGGKSTDDGTPCPKFEMPKREPLPKIPDIRGLTNDQVNSVLINLIKQHRDYIDTEHKNIDDIYTVYLSHCSPKN